MGQRYSIALKAISFLVFLVLGAQGAAAQTYSCPTTGFGPTTIGSGGATSTVQYVTAAGGCVTSFPAGVPSIEILHSAAASGHLILARARDAGGGNVLTLLTCDRGTRTLVNRVDAPHGTTTCTATATIGVVDVSASISVTSSTGSDGSGRTTVTGSMTPAPVTFTAAAPILTLSGPATAGANFNLTLRSDQALDPSTVTASDILGPGGTSVTVGDPVMVSASEFTFPVTTTVDANLVFIMPANSVSATTGLGNPTQVVSNTIDADGLGPRPTLSALPGLLGLGGADVRMTFDEPVTGVIEPSDFNTSQIVVNSVTRIGPDQFTVNVAASGNSTIASLQMNSGAVTDAAGNANRLSSLQVTRTIATRPQISFNSASVVRDASGNPTVLARFDFTEFSGDPAFIDNASLAVITGGTQTGTSFSYASGFFTVSFRPSGGPVTIAFPEGFMEAQFSNNGSPAFGPEQVGDFDFTPPSVTISGTPGFPGVSYPVTITFSEPVSGFTGDDIRFTGAFLVPVLVNICGADPCDSFIAFVRAEDGSEFTHTLQVREDSAQDRAGNNNTISNLLTPPPPDGVAPVLAISGLPADGFGGPQTATVTFDFGEEVFGFEDADITVNGGTLGPITGGRQTWTATLNVAGDADVSVTVAAGSVQDTTGTPIAETQATAAADLTPPTVSISGTPGFPGDPYAIDITFSEPVNGFVLGDITGTNAGVSDFVNDCGTDPCATFSAVVTADAGSEFSHSVQVLAGVAQDAASNDNLASAAFGPPPPDGTAPVVAITGVPDGFTGPVTATVSFDWGEDVLGFEDGDITVTGGTLGPITGGRQVWTALLTVEGNANVTVTVAASAVQDASGTASAAAAITGAFASGTVAEEIIRDFLSARALALLAAQPDLTGLLGNGGPTGNIQVSRGVGDIDLFTGTEGPIWAALDAQWSDLDGFETAYTHLTFGSHIYLQDETLLGVMLQFDHASSTEGVAEIEGTGWLVGPYYVARYGGLDVDARLLWGRTENEISPLGTYTDTFASERVLAMVNLSGEIQMERMSVRPLLGWSYVDDRSEAYIDALSNPVAAQRVQIRQLETALDWTMPLGPEGMEFVGGLAGLFTAEEGGNNDVDGARARIDLGLRRQGAGPVGFDLGVFYDGLGQSSYEAYGLDLTVDWRF